VWGSGIHRVQEEIGEGLVGPCLKLGGVIVFSGRIRSTEQVPSLLRTSQWLGKVSLRQKEPRRV
jgi:hypothetical protein